MIGEGDYRERLGRNACAYARAHWSPDKCEAVFVENYQNLLAAQQNLASSRMAV